MKGKPRAATVSWVQPGNLQPKWLPARLPFMFSVTTSLLASLTHPSLTSLTHLSGYVVYLVHICHLRKTSLEKFEQLIFQAVLLSSKFFKKGNGCTFYQNWLENLFLQGTAQLKLYRGGRQSFPGTSWVYIRLIMGNGWLATSQPKSSGKK